MCPSQQFSGGHFSFLRDTKFVSYVIKKIKLGIESLSYSLVIIKTNAQLN